MCDPDRVQAGTPAGRLAGSVDLRIPSCAFGVRAALASFIRALAPLDLGPEEAGTVELVLAEALNNIVEHAYGGGTSTESIAISARHLPDGLHVCIRDQGQAMPGGQPPLGLLPAPDADGPPEGGFGWFLIRDLAKDVRYRRVAGENRLDLRLAVAMARPH